MNDEHANNAVEDNTPVFAPSAATAAAAAAASAAAAAATAAATAADAAASANTAATAASVQATTSNAGPADASPFGAQPKMHPLFPGSTFISTILDVLNSKDTMTGKMLSKYMQRAIMAGFFVGVFFTAFFVILATFSAQGPSMALAGKVLGALTFGWALVLIYYTNSELLTSNMMIISIGAYHKRIGWLHSLRILGFCLLGNLIGGLVVALLLRASTVITGDVYEQMLAAVQLKTGYLLHGVPGIADLFVRAIFCNFCINIAMLMCYNGKLINDFTKCIIMIVAVFVFAYLGFEHSIANSVLFLIMGMYGAVDPLLAVGSICITILGNFVGGGLLIGINFAVMNDQSGYHAARALKHNIGRR